MPGACIRGHQVPGLAFSAPIRSSAARAAHRDARPLLHLFRANYSWGIGARPLGAPLNIASYKQGGRAQMPLASLARNKCRSELSSRCAARAALDFRPTSKPKTGT
jgi:hypothetical protein